MCHCVLCLCVCVFQGGCRHIFHWKEYIFFWGGEHGGAKSLFLTFLVYAFLSGGNFHFCRVQANFSGFRKWKKKKKSSLLIFIPFLPFHLKFSTFPFTVFLLFFSIFPFFLASVFPIGQQKFSCEKHGGALCPYAVMPMHENQWTSRIYLFLTFYSNISYRADFLDLAPRE